MNLRLVEDPPNGRAADLRHDFDRSFAQALTRDVEALEDLLTIIVGTTSYALRVTEIAGLFVDKTITRLPTPAPDLLGIAGFRGTVLPVYDLRVLLGSKAGAAPRWLVVTAARAVALAFDGFEAHVRVPCSAIVGGDAAPGPHVQQIVCTESIARPIVSIESLLEGITARAHSHNRQKER